MTRKKGKGRKKEKRSRYVVVGADGRACFRCGSSTEIREHREITARELARPFYYSRWFNCPNDRCRTTLIMPPEFIVQNTRATT